VDAGHLAVSCTLDVMMRHAIVVLVLLGCSSNPGGGSTDPCAMTSVYTCDSQDGRTCDEVYTVAGETELAMYCHAPYHFSSSGRCPAALQCCFHSVGYGDGPQMHCVSTDVDPNYRIYCADNGGTYCER
jgi:hypothetical protein